MKKLFLLTALFVAAAFPSCSKHDGVETPDWPEPQPLAIAFAEGNSLQFDVGETKTVHYTITGGNGNTVVKAEMQTSDDAYAVETTPASATEGTITITAKKPSNENRIIVTVSDGSQTLTAEIAVSTNPRPQELVITFAEGNLLLLNINEPKTVHYTITGGSAKTVVTAEMQKPDDAYAVETTPTSTTEGTITITAKKPSNENRIIVTVSDGSQTLTAEIAVTFRVFDGKTVVVEIPGSLGYWLAPYESSIIELTVIGTLNSSDIATLKNLPNLAILDMENVNLEALPADTFRNKTSLTSVKLPKTLKKIGSYAFSGCSGLTSVTIPDSVTSIGDRAFQDCSSLTSVTIPDSVTSIPIQTFDGCSSLTSVTIPDGVTTIGSSAFNGCSSLTSVTIPDSVTEICYCAFSGCRSLTSVTIGNSVKYIENYAFDGCSGLTSVTIGNSVTFIDSEAFRGCSSLTRVYCKAIVPPIIVNNTFDKVSATATLYVPTGCKAAYAAATEWSKFKTIEETQF
ncbi:leucine-rich repeat domain-containing protein [uncultured Alistipes sp.]|uniref:leucine-rich repeat domain-containing protein n=2 Tax=Alistipes TaxID=239759 RepID=UPI002597529E|nr:leucine-rich repeat domain-containing protein [uncultured Alistipes sp.]